METRRGDTRERGRVSGEEVTARREMEGRAE